MTSLPFALPIALSLACLACTAALVTSIQQGWVRAKVVLKTLASLAFIAVALSLGATQAVMGQWLLPALVLSAIGDLCLLASGSRAFLAGLGSFLLAHVVFAVAFATRPLSVVGAAVGGALMLGVAIAALRWMWPHLRGAMRPAVIAYVVTIAVMVAIATAHTAGGGTVLVAAGALLFAASDLAVARQTFVAPGPVNQAWGLPAYYVAQLMLAWSLAR